MSVFCPECGANLAPETIKCPDCGAMLESEPTRTPPLTSNPVPETIDKGNAPSDLIGDRNNIMGSVTGTKIDAASYTESHTIDNSRHEHSTTHDNSNHVHNNTTIIQNGENIREYCTVCGNVLRKDHARCPECDRKICPECRVPGKNRCKSCEEKARDEYRLEFRNLLLEMGGTLNVFGRRIMDDKARRLNLIAEKSEIEKEFTPHEENNLNSKRFGVQTATPPPDAPPTEDFDRFVSEFKRESLKHSSRSLGALDGNTPIIPVDSGKNDESDNSTTKPSETLSAAIAEAANHLDENKSGSGAMKYIIAGIIACIAITGVIVALIKFNSASSTDNGPTNIVAPERKPLPIPASFREIPNFTQTTSAAWAQKKMPKDWERLIALNLQAKSADEKALSIARKLEGNSATWGSYTTNPDFISAKKELDSVELEGKTVLEKIETAYANRPKTKPYTLVRGDTPTRICAKNNVTMEQLRELNPGVEFIARKMQIGQVINVPADDEPSPSSEIQTDPPTAQSTETLPPKPPSPKESPQKIPDIVGNALSKIPTEKHELISAYNRAGLVYLDGNTREFLAFCKSLDSRQLALSKAILEAFPSIVNEVYQDKRSGEKRTILAWATKNRADSDLIRRFIEMGADVNAVTSKGETALSYAVSSRNLEAVKALLAAGADVNFKTADGLTMIELARGNQAIIALLFDAKKSFTAEDLKTALLGQNTDIKQVRKILDFGVTPSSDLMYLAVRKGDAQILEAFLEAGGNANAQYDTVPIIFYTNYSGDISCAKLLVDYGADTNFTVRISGRTAYRTYLKNRNATELLKYIESAGTRPKKRTTR